MKISAQMTPMKMIGSQVSIQPLIPAKTLPAELPLSPSSAAATGASSAVDPFESRRLSSGIASRPKPAISTTTLSSVVLLPAARSNASSRPVAPWSQPVAGGTQ
jgi:hypothetical protein